MLAIMSTAFFLIPGARLGAQDAADLLASASPEERDALESLGALREAPETQCLTGRLDRFAPHHAWAWKVFARRSGEALDAPALWRIGEGPHFSAPLMRFVPLVRTPKGDFAQAELQANEMMPFLGTFGKLAFRFQLTLQINGTDLFLADKAAHAFSCAPVAARYALLPFCRALRANHEATLDFEALLAAGVEGPDADWAKHFLRTAQSCLMEEPELRALNEARASAGLPLIAAFWLSNPGPVEGYHPPSLFRAVLADDPVIRGWALAAGIPAWRVRTLTKPKRANDMLNKLGWPDEVPPGDVVAVLDDLYEPWLCGDLDQWRRALSPLTQKLAALRADLKRLNVEEDAIVLFGTAGAATLMQKKTGLLDRFRRPAAVLPEAWLSDPFEEAFK